MPRKSRKSNDSKLIVVALEGCHGSGKTSLCAEFEAQGYKVLDETFMTMPSYSLHPQSMLMESAWVCSWFERVLRLADELRREKRAVNRTQVYFADRSPFSAVYYAGASGHLLEPVIRAQMKEVEEQANILFYTVHVSVEKELLWKRICDRLEDEPERVRYNEHKRDWMDKTLAFYNTFEWDFTISNDDGSVSTIMKELETTLRGQDATFRMVYERKKHVLTDETVSSVASTDSEEDVDGTSMVAFNNRT